MNTGRRLGLWATLALVLAYLACSTSTAQSGPRRVALVIGNGAYASASQLSNPKNDVQLVSRALGKAGFGVVTVLSDLKIDGMRNALRDFQRAADRADVAVVYFAGHGIEANGRNWLIPTDAKLLDQRDLNYEAIDMQLVLDAISGARMRVMALDACRDNPFGKAWRAETRAVTRGFVAMDADDVLVLYAAAPGQVAADGTGANSPFAAALARRLPQAGLPLQMLGGMVRDDVLEATGGRQRPFVSASVTGTPYYLVAAPSTAISEDERAELVRLRAEARARDATAKTDDPADPDPIAANFNAPADLQPGRAYVLAVSRYDGPMDWPKIYKSGIRFAYFKASQGSQSVDPSFRQNVEEARRNGIRVGAFHFLSPASAAEAQMNNFLGAYAGLFQKGDLPPMLDMEWDFAATTAGDVERTDRWSAMTPEAVALSATTWLSGVENRLGVRPAIYTNAVWWRERLGEKARPLQGYKLWVADYSKASRQKGAPKLPADMDWALWEFTDRAAIKDIDKKTMALSIVNPSVQSLFQ